MTALAEGKKPLVALVRKRATGTTLGLRKGRKRHERNDREQKAFHGLLTVAGPGSRPTVQSKRTVNLRWLQSGPAAPFVRWCE